MNDSPRDNIRHNNDIQHLLDCAKLNYIWTDLSRTHQTGLKQADYVLVYHHFDDETDILWLTNKIYELRQTNDNANIILFCDSAKFDQLKKLILVGLDALIDVFCSADEMAIYMEFLKKGEKIISPKLTSLLMNNRSSSLPKEELTERERAVLSNLVQGKTYQEISNRLCLSLDGIRYHIRNIYRKLCVRSKVEAINVALMYNL